VAGRLVATGQPEAVENVYARRVFPVVARLVSAATGWLPFSLSETIVIAGVIAIAAAGLRVLLRARWRRWTAASVAGGVARLAAAIALAVFAFDLAWGYNYDRAPVAALLRYDLAPAPADDLAALAAELLAQAAALREGLPEDAAGVLRLTDGRRGALGRAARGYAAPQLVHRLPVPHLSAPPKLVLLSPLMSYLGIGGIFIPYTCEANVNATLPDWEIPFTSAHELAHQRGFAREEEANYVGYLACRAHPDRDFQYSGTFRPRSTRWPRWPRRTGRPTAGCAGPSPPPSRVISPRSRRGIAGTRAASEKSRSASTTRISRPRGRRTACAATDAWWTCCWRSGGRAGTVEEGPRGTRRSARTA